MFLDDFFRYKINYNPHFLSTGTFSIILYVLLFLLCIYFYKLLNNSDNKISMLIFIILMIYLILIIINHRISTNYYLTKKYIKPEVIVNELNTGDIVLFRSYDLDGIETLSFHTMLCLQETFFTHVAFIYKNLQGNTFIIESNDADLYCKLSKKKKGGVQIIDFHDRINNNKYHRIHIYKSNLHKFLDINKLYDSINKYKDYNFFQDGVYCLSLVTRIYQENGLLKNDNIIPYMLDDIIKPKNYLVPVVFEEPILVKKYKND